MEHKYILNAIRGWSWNPDDLTDGYTEFHVCVRCGDVREVEIPPEDDVVPKWADGAAS